MTQELYKDTKSNSISHFTEFCYGDQGGENKHFEMVWKYISESWKIYRLAKL